MSIERLIVLFYSQDLFNSSLNSETMSTSLCVCVGGVLLELCFVIELQPYVDTRM